ncbi:MAG: hypothetical protein AWU58_1504 [Methanohalophilus sp. T328-1]|uniref:prenylated flavin chaperone LpdD n=1 Tax=Methanohalophilus sp. DAL1 TaxID=1864608 RepID=UPI000796656A|nr:hypothetical protein [Methanohalophilus sp. DAL1]KXS42322.1 MAG: hypothetical protein AWU58_1504 [Methanohalophilus sp. T328-1]OBZ35281.1 MAG: hypothetical protein A9957_08145 [Methanohalophilus sp. DAL1]
MEVIEKKTGKRKLFLRWRIIGDSLLVTLTGGDEHIGAVAVGNSGASSVITLPGHRDDEIAHRQAGRINRKTGKDTVFLVGIHFDNIQPDEIRKICDTAELMVDELIDIIEE